MFIDFRETGKTEREGDEKQIGCLPYVPSPGIEPTTQACALTGNQTCNLLVHG